MHQFVRSAINAANQGDNDKAIAFLKQVIDADPNDIDAWMVLAAVVDDPIRKRQCLRRVLAINPTHQLAREELMEMDRAEMESESLSTPEPVAYSTEHSYGASDTVEQNPLSTSAGTQPMSSSKISDDETNDKTLIFQYPLIIRIAMYALVIIPSFLGLLVATKNIFGGLIFLVPGLITLIAVLVFLPTVEINSSGVSVSTALSSSEIGWDKIAKVKSNNKLQLIQNKTKAVSIPKQVEGYSQIIEIVRERRPDLFGATTPTLSEIS